MSSQKCDICFEEKSPDSFGFLPCTHSFCAVCIGKLRENVCPMCRNPFEEYSQTSYANSVPNPVTITTYLGNNNQPIEQNVADDFYITQEMQVHRRLDERTRRRMRRRRRRLSTNRRRRRSETVTEEIFQIDDILDGDNAQEEKPKNTSKNNPKPKGDHWQRLRQQRSRYNN